MISITEAAARQARQIMLENDLPQGGLKLGVKAGGCSGLNYVLDIVEEPDANDRVSEWHGIPVYCDPKSYLFLDGLVVDYKADKMGGGFTFENPNAKRSCGCGTSFAV